MTVRDPNILHHPGLQPLWDAVQLEWRQQQYTGVGLLLLGITVLTFGAGYQKLGLALLGALAVCGAIFWLMRLSARKPVSELYHLFLEEPDRVKWVYSVVTERLPFGLKFTDSATLYLVLDDGDEISVALPAKQLKLVTKTLNRVLPKAAFGYSKEREEKFRPK